MDTPTPVALTVKAPEYGMVMVEASDGFCYHADLSRLSSVYCFPPDEKEWATVHTDSYGLALLWTSRFEVHMDQVVGLAHKKEPVARTA